jgi:hypothetical protein
MAEELGLQSGDSHPLAGSPYPAYRDPSMQALIHSRHNATTAMRKGAASGKGVRGLGRQVARFGAKALR